MPGKDHTTTDEFVHPGFSPHGRVEYDTQGQLLRSTACGPFNAELMESLAEMARNTFPHLAARGPWANIAVFQHSAVCAPSVMQALSAAMQEMVANRIHPTATAFVLAPDVEGAALMGPLYAKAYADAGATFAYFQDESQALAWLASVVGDLGVNAGP